MQKFTADVEKLNNVTAVRLAGELDANTAVSADDALQEAIHKTSDKALLIDCTDLHYISSAGLGVILSSLHACKEKEIKVAFFGMQPKIKNVFAILGLEKIINSAPDEKAAIKILNNGSNSNNF